MVIVVTLVPALLAYVVQPTYHFSQLKRTHLTQAVDVDNGARPASWCRRLASSQSVAMAEEAAPRPAEEEPTPPKSNLAKASASSESESDVHDSDDVLSSAEEALNAAAGFAVAEGAERVSERARKAARWGERHPGATDWIRRDASELAWRERLKQDWAEQDGRDLDRSLARQLGMTGAEEDDWRLLEFEELLQREQSWRANIYRWWLGVCDASGDDYLFEPGEQDDVGWPATRFDGTPWDEPPKDALSRREIPSRKASRSSYGGSPTAGRRRSTSSYYEEDEEDRGASDMVYGGRPRRLGKYRAPAFSNDGKDEEDEVDEADEVDYRDDYGEDYETRRRRLPGSRLRDRWRRWRDERKERRDRDRRGLTGTGRTKHGGGRGAVPHAFIFLRRESEQKRRKFLRWPR